MSSWLIGVVTFLYTAAAIDSFARGKYGMTVMLVGWAIGCVGAIMVGK